jgi:iron complex outermembrane receptor protein
LLRAAPTTLSIGGALLAAVTPAAGQTEAPGIALAPVEVIGSRARATRADETLIPVDVIDGETLRRAGAVNNELGEALALVQPSFSFPRQSNSVTSDHVRSAQLRGLNPDQVLVLVNGKRRHVSAVVNDNTKIGRGTNAFDFNTIPLSAVERVEILRDGASALYGSDAIAGVINIVLAEDLRGASLGLTAGAHHTEVEAIDRSLTDGQTAGLWWRNGHGLDGGGFVAYGAEVSTRNATDRAGFDRVSPFIPQTEDNLAFRGQRTHRVGDPDTDAASLWFNAERPLEGLTVYGFGTAHYRETEGAAVYRYPDSNQNVPTLFPDGFRPVTTGENADLGLTFGARQTPGRWALDHALSLGHNRFEFGVRNSLNPALGPDSPTRFESGTFEFSQVVFSSEARRRFDDALAGRAVQLAAGVNARHERFESSPGDPAAHRAGDFEYAEPLASVVGFPDIGAQGAKGLSPADAGSESRAVVGVFAEVSASPSERLETSVAARFEHYSDFGSTLTGKLAARYRAGESTALRASLSNSFRAPSLSQLGWARRDNTFSSEGGRIASRLVANDAPIADALGIGPLDEETSINASLGLTWTYEGLTLTADAFEIRVDDRITLSAFIRDPAVVDFVQGLPGGQGVQALSFFTNGVDTRTRGVEVAARYALATEGGLWRFSSAYTHARTRIREVAPPPGELAAIAPGIDLLGVEERNTIETATPEHRWISSASWQGTRWRLDGRLRVFSSVVREFAFARQRFGGQYALDAEISYAVDERWQVMLGANNLTDRYPEASEPANDFFGNFAYDPINPIGLNGRYVYLRTVVDF